MNEYSSLAEMLTALHAEGFTHFNFIGSVYPADARYHAHPEQWQMRELGIWSDVENCWVHFGEAVRKPV